MHCERNTDTKNEGGEKRGGARHGEPKGFPSYRGNSNMGCVGGGRTNRLTGLGLVRKGER